MAEWRNSTWGDEINLEYGRALRDYAEADGAVRVFGTNGPIGWTDIPLAPGPGIILGRKGAYRGVHYSPNPFFVIDTAYYVVPKTELDMRWLYYAIIHYQLGQLDDGSPIPSTTRAAVYPRELAVPLPNEQHAIAGVLGALDDKIEQNRRTARALERQARGIFRAWFVDFEPVKAKAEGAASFQSMPKDVFDALPNRLVETESGPVPEGWDDWRYRVADLEKRGYLLIGDGYRAKRTELADRGLPFIRAGDVDGTVNTHSAEFLGEEAVAKAGVKRSQLWDTVFTSKGTVGRIGLVTPSTGEVVYAPQVCFWRSLNRKIIDPFFLHLWMRSTSFTNQWMSVKGQTDMADFVSLSDQRAMQLTLPTSQLQTAFAAIVEPLIRVRAQLDFESRSLAGMRDYLLPRLLSGRIRVKAANG